MKEFKGIFRIGIFLAYIESAMPTWIGLRDFLREKGFVSSYLVQDYPNAPGEDNRTKSFYFLRNCHVAFFVVEADVGKGGVVSELEEYKRVVYPRLGKKVFLFEKCSNMGDKLKEDPSTVISPNLTDNKFNIRRFLGRDELPKQFYGAAKQAFFEAYLRPYTMLDEPRRRLTCQVCGRAESKYICINRCKPNCDKYHICETDISHCGTASTDHLYAFPRSL